MISLNTSKPSGYESLAGQLESPVEQFDLEGILRDKQAAEEDSGIKLKRIGVLWEDLTVSGTSVTNSVRTFPGAILRFFNIFETAKNVFCFKNWEKGDKVDILSDFRGLATPGEMILVLGRPGSGCSTFLRVIANQRSGYTSIDGTVLYGPFDQQTFAKEYRGEAVYCQEDDIHHGTLTVRQTLGFALDAKIPEKRPYGISRFVFKERAITTLMRMLGIEHTQDTLVGGAFVRGISGGERRRVSIAETLATSATVFAWDNSTRGLDASTALDFIKSLRVIADVYRTTSFISLYQASDNIYNQFDKVLVIYSGKQVFFGPASEARQYFENLGYRGKPRQTTADFLTGCTDEFERDFAEGTPHSPGTLAQAFLDSKYTTQLDAEMDTYQKSLIEDQQTYDDFKTAVLESKTNEFFGSSVYSISYHMQIWVLMQRQFAMKWQDKFTFVVGWITSIIVAFLLGTVWLNLPTTSAGAFTRGGLLINSLLFNVLQAVSELAGTMIGRPIVNKHKAYSFHRPSALWFAQLVVDLAFSAVQILIFSIIVYLMCGLARDATAFFTYYLIIITSYIAMTLFFRTIGCLCPDFDYAIKFLAIIISLFIITCGYVIQFQNEKVWLRWIYWINTLGLAFSALMENEFSRLILSCTSESLIPSGQGYTNIENQVCTLPGSTAGTTEVLGSAYLTQGFNYHPADLWRNWGLIMVLVVVFLILNTTLGEWLTFENGNTTNVFLKQNNERKRLNRALSIKRDFRRTAVGVVKSPDTGIAVASKSFLTWEGLHYDVPTPSGQRRLLDNIYGYVKPSELTALMGASGAGKTTLLDCLANRKNVGVVTGDILVDGVARGHSFQRGTSYAEQLDMHEPTATVREALRFSAELRQPPAVPQSEKFAFVEDILTLLEMEDIADAVIGQPGQGLTVEARKRVTIGVELAAKPELLLFLDEPTSGLDSQAAFNIVRFLKKLSSAGQAIICTIHQPNAALFENFDRLLLLHHGRCAYFGKTGEETIEYFRKNGAEYLQDANPAEWILDVIGAGQAPRFGDRDWADIFADSPELAGIKDHITQLKTERRLAATTEQTNDQKFATPFWHQLKVVTKRTNVAFWRSPNYGFTRLFNHVLLALITGLAYLHLDDSPSSLQYRVFIIFQTITVPGLILPQVELKHASSRMIYHREASSRMYKHSVFTLSLLLAELPYCILCSVAFFLPLYYMPGFQSASDRAGYQFLMILLSEIFAVTLAQAISALTPTPKIAAILNPFIITTFNLFCGVTIPKPQIPKFWRAWLYYLDPFMRVVSGMVVTELHGRPVSCPQDELLTFTSPSGQNCGEYMAPFFERGGAGYIVNNASSVCEYCAYTAGEQFYLPLGLDFNHRWVDLGIFAAFVGTNLIILFVGSRYLSFNRR